MLIIGGKGVLVLGVSLALLLNACVSTPTRDDGSYVSSSSLTPSEQRLREQSSGLDAKTSIQGCVAGAVAGALLGMLSDGKREQNMMIGAAAGCAVGFAANAYVQSKRQQYQNTERRIAAITEDVRADNARVAALIATSEEVIANDRNRLTQINESYQAKAASTEQAKRELASVKANRDHLNSTVSSLKTKQADWVEVAALERQAGSDTSPLDQEIDLLQRRIAGLEKEVALIDQQINASPVAG